MEDLAIDLVEGFAPSRDQWWVFAVGAARDVGAGEAVLGFIEGACCFA